MRTRRRSSLIEAKIKNLTELKNIAYRLKKAGKKIVFTNGCFDLLHYGHIKYLEAAKRKGDILIVAINSDVSVRKIKGEKRPIVKEHDRSRIVAALESVDYVVLFKECTPYKTLSLLKPDILVKGSDWNKNNIVGADVVLNYRGKVTTVPLLKDRSTTNLIKKIARIF